MAALTRAEQGGLTRESLMTTAEQLFAAQGLGNVSARQISEAAGQGNNTAVGYHFGSKHRLVVSIMSQHLAAIEDARIRMTAAVPASAPCHDWIDCLVRPYADHLAELPQPTAFARLSAQLYTDPVFRQAIEHEALESPSLHEVLRGLESTQAAMPEVVRTERYDMCRMLLVLGFAKRELQLSEGSPVLHSTWDEAADGIVDALAGLWSAPWPGTDRVRA